MSTSNNRYNNEVQLTWKDEDSKSSKIQKLSAEKLMKLMAPNSKGLDDITALSLSNRQMCQIDNLNGLHKLARLDISKNSLTRLQHFNEIPHVTLLNASQNDLNSDAALEELRYLTALRTLNVGMNARLKSIRSHIVKPLGNLQVLIANDCGLTKVSFLKFLPCLNTLVLSHNKLTSFTFDEVGSLKFLVKCSLGHNEFTQVPDFTAICSAAHEPSGNRREREQADFYDNKLEELRLNSNLISGVGKTIVRNRHLKTLDLSSNRIASWDDVKTLAELPNLTNLSIHNNLLEVLQGAAEAALAPGSTHSAGGAPLARHVDGLPIREDISAAAVRERDPSGRESLLRRYTLYLFQRTVGREAKLHIQLVVLDMRRVKDKWSHDNDAEAAGAGKKDRKTDKIRGQIDDRDKNRDIEKSRDDTRDRSRGRKKDRNQAQTENAAFDRDRDRGLGGRLEKPHGNRDCDRGGGDQPRKKQRNEQQPVVAADADKPMAKPAAGILSSDDTEAVQRAFAASLPADMTGGGKDKGKEVTSSQYTGVKGVKVFDPNAATVSIGIKSPTKRRKEPEDAPSVLTAVTSASVDVGTGSGSGWD